jgi:hypothetical protein
MAQPVAKRLLASPLIHKDFRGRYLLPASDNLDSATLNHQIWPRAHEGLKNNVLTEQERKAKDLFFQSFRFSQGTVYLQEDIFLWLVAKGYYDDIEVPENVPSYIQEGMVVPKKHAPITQDADKTKALTEGWERLYAAKESKQSLDADELLEPILEGLLAKDSDYQEIGRPNRPYSEQVTPDSNNDPHASFVRRHILNAHPTGNDAFDELFRSLALHLKEENNLTFPFRDHGQDSSGLQVKAS